jgi:D-3-phosphoglycerate dehydrogenase
MSKKFTALLVEKIDEAGMSILNKVAEVKFASSNSEKVLAEEVREVDALIIRVRGKVSKKVIKNARKLKVVGHHGAGLDNIDLQAATERGIPVVYTPDANTESVADHTIGLMIAVAKKIPQAHYALTRDKNWSIRYECIGTEIYKKTLGLIGLGRIGRSVVGRAKGFKMRVLAYDPYISEDVTKKLGVKLVDLKTLLSNSDFVSIHVPSTKETHKMIGKRELEIMKSKAFLINTSRGGVVDEVAVYKALIKGKLAGAAFDVYEKEPPDPNNPLFKLDNVVATPHMAAHTEEALRSMAITVARDTVKVLKGKRPKYVANPEIFK